MIKINNIDNLYMMLINSIDFKIEVINGQVFKWFINNGSDIQNNYINFTYFNNKQFELELLF